MMQKIMANLLYGSLGHFASYLDSIWEKYL